MYRLAMPAALVASLLLAACQTTSGGATAGASRDQVQQEVYEKARDHENRNRGRGGP